MTTTGQLLGILALAAFCAIWVAVAEHRRHVRSAIEQRNLHRAVEREIARNYEPERVR